MTITTGTEHGYKNGKFVTLTGIGMTCQYSTSPKYYPNRTYGYNIVRVDGVNQFTVNVGVSTVPTFYKSGGYVVGLSTGQYVSYSKGPNAGVSTGFTDDKIYKVRSVGVNTTTGISTVQLSNLDGTETLLNGLTNFTGISSHVLVTPVPFVQPTTNSTISNRNTYSTVKPTGMFPYMYDDGADNFEGYIDTTLSAASSATLKHN